MRHRDDHLPLPTRHCVSWLRSVVRWLRRKAKQSNCILVSSLTFVGVNPLTYVKMFFCRVFYLREALSPRPPLPSRRHNSYSSSVSRWPSSHTSIKGEPSSPPCRDSTNVSGSVSPGVPKSAQVVFRTTVTPRSAPIVWWKTDTRAWCRPVTTRGILRPFSVDVCPSLSPTRSPYTGLTGKPTDLTQVSGDGGRTDS